MTASVSLTLLADFFCERREQITSEWIDRVREEREITAADVLPKHELMDHLPNLFDHLTDQLRAGDRAVQAEDAARDAQAHGEHRWHQNYALDELLREAAVLRKVFMRHLFTFQTEHPSFVQEAEWRAHRIIHSFFDTVLIDSTTQFVARQHEELRTANHSLQQATLRVQQFNERLLEQDDRRLQMLRTISHEVRNHLNAVSVVVMILGKEENPATCHEYIEMLSRNVIEITGLVNQLLDFAALLSGGERAELERIDAAPLFNELVLFLTEMAHGKGLAFQSRIDSDLGEIVTDRLKVHRIAMNLTTNAIKYTSQGEVCLSFVAAGADEWAIEVRDTGPGIPPQDRERIFEEFHRVASTAAGHPGSGLGLAITQQLVQLLGGRIELESEVGKGTQFRVVLPRKPK